MNRVESVVNPPAAGFLQHVVSWAPRGPQATWRLGWSCRARGRWLPLHHVSFLPCSPGGSLEGRLFTSSRGELTVALKVGGVVLIGPEVTTWSPRSGGDTRDQRRASPCSLFRGAVWLMLQVCL